MDEIICNIYAYNVALIHRNKGFFPMQMNWMSFVTMFISYCMYLCSQNIILQSFHYHHLIHCEASS